MILLYIEILFFYNLIALSMDKFKVVDGLLPVPPWFEKGKTYVWVNKEIWYDVANIWFIPLDCIVILGHDVSDVWVEEHPGKSKRVNEDNTSKDILVTEKDPKEKIIERCKNFQEKYRDKIDDKNTYRELFRNDLDHAIDKHL